MDDHCTNNTFCSSLEETTKKRLCKACLQVNLKPKQEVLFKIEANQIAIIHSGLLISFVRTEEGEKKCMGLLKAGDLIGSEKIFNHEPEETNPLLTVTDVTLCLFPIPVFETFFHQCQDFSINLVQWISRRLQQNLLGYLISQTTSSEEKVRFVIDFLKQEKIDISSITHQDIALITNLNRVTVSRALKSILYSDD